MSVENYPILRTGSKGFYVTECQELLIKNGYALPTYGADGDYGNETRLAIIAFQNNNGLEPDGICGPATWNALSKQSAPDEPISPEAEHLIEVALGELGYLEKNSNASLDDKTANVGYNNWTKYARDIDQNYPNFYNGRKNGYAWCDVFVDWCFITAFGVENALKLLCAPQKSCGAGCSFSANYFRNNGQFYKNPKVGDQIFFGDYGNEGHTGIVCDVDNTYVYTVEGNTSGTAGVVANGGGVFKKQYKLGSSSISGYGRPDYSIVAGQEFESPIDTPVIDDSPVAPSDITGGEIEVTLNMLKTGDKGAQVRAMQILLIGNGCSCGGAGADGDFGSGTLSAVRSFQSAKGLGVDGICGVNTWTKLLK